MSYAHIYPEISLPRRAMTYHNPFNGQDVTLPASEGPPEFPTSCPACGAGQADLRPWHGCTYACGGDYTEKPQIQNHTDKWWGSCPVTRAANS